MKSNGGSKPKAERMPAESVLLKQFELLDEGDKAILRDALDDSIPRYTEVLDMDPENREALLYRALARRETDSLSKALKDYDKLIELYPDFAEAYLGRAVTNLRDDDSAAALEDFTKAFELDPTMIRALVGRALLTIEDNQDYNSALADFTRALEMEPDNAALYYYRAHVYKCKEQYDLAVQDYNEALSKKSDIKFYVGRALANYMLQNWDEVIKDTDEAISLDDKHVQAYFLRGCAKEYKNPSKEDLSDPIRDFSRAYYYDRKFVLARQYAERLIQYEKDQKEKKEERAAIAKTQPKASPAPASTKAGVKTAPKAAPAPRK